MENCTTRFDPRGSKLNGRTSNGFSVQGFERVNPCSQPDLHSLSLSPTSVHREADLLHITLVCEVRSNGENC